MKKTFTLSAFLIITITMFGQISLDWPPNEFQIGTTYYDLQTSRSMQDRICHFTDGTIGAVFNMKVDPNAQDELKIGYNYYDGSAWGEQPMNSITSGEATNPSYTSFGENGEICASEGENGIYISYRLEKGTGDWQEMVVTGPTGNGKLYSPQVATSGVDDQIINLFTFWEDPDLVNLGQENTCKVLYSRSTDMGATWDPNLLELDLDIGSFGFSKMSIKPADPIDNTLAFVVGDYFTNLLLVKSTDGGDTWEETVIWEHPFPYMQFGVTVTDTFWANSGSMDIALDENLRANVVFALCRIKSDENGWYYDPLADGIVYWNEDMDLFTNNVNALSPIGHPDSELIEDYNLIAWTQDIDQNGEINFIQGEDNPPFYPSLGVSTTPSISTNEFGYLFVIWSSVTESYYNNDQNFRHLWARMSINNGAWWGAFDMLTNNLVHIFDECVFPNVSAHVDDNLHLVYQVDQEPGLSTITNNPPSESFINYMQVPLEYPPGPSLWVYFAVDSTTIHEGDTVHFSNNSVVVPVDSLSFEWIFDGGTPATSTEFEPYVIYNTEGVYDVTLFAESAYLTNSLTKVNYITVLPQTGLNELTNNSNITIAPNPASNTVLIQTKGYIINTTRIVDFLGKVVLETPSGGVGDIRLDVSTLQRGIYFIAISGEDFTHTEKLILK
ncbi:MAG TPA: T9SS type A sorting domain-containing protein [Bacteroidales bacterium]|nr:T9SS type A sorting domain-containing protein [Bacteroidales bacterium]